MQLQASSFANLVRILSIGGYTFTDITHPFRNKGVWTCTVITKANPSR